MKIILKLAFVLYIAGAIGIFALHTVSPVTLGLAAARSVLWPVWITTGHPQGEPTWRDGE